MGEGATFPDDRALGEGATFSDDRALGEEAALSHDRALGEEAALSHDRALGGETHPQPRERGPDFVCVGVQRCGTNWLTWVLRQHPGVFVPRKEIRFFVRFFHRGWRWYEDQFDDKAGRMAGELSVHYVYSPREAMARREFYPRWNPRRRLVFWRRYPAARDELFARYPDLRVFAIFRNPVDRAWSHYARWCRLRERRRKRVVPFERMFADDGRWIRTQGNYADLLARWRERFPEMGVFFYDDLVARPRELAREVYRFVGVADDVVPEVARRVNAGSYDPMPDAVRARLTDGYREQILRLQAMTGRDLSGWLDGKLATRD